MGTRIAAECHQARRMRESVFVGQVRRRRAEGAGVARAPPRAGVAVGHRFCLLEVVGSKSLWARVARNCPKEDTTVASHQRVAEAPLQAVLVALLPAAAAVRKRQTEASRGAHRRAQPTPGRKQLSRMRRQAEKYTHCPSFCNLYIFHRGSGCNHCNESRQSPRSVNKRARRVRKTSQERFATNFTFAAVTTCYRSPLARCSLLRRTAWTARILRRVGTIGRSGRRSVATIVVRLGLRMWREGSAAGVVVAWLNSVVSLVRRRLDRRQVIHTARRSRIAVWATSGRSRVGPARPGIWRWWVAARAISRMSVMNWRKSDARLRRRRQVVVGWP